MSRCPHHGSFAAWLWKSEEPALYGRIINQCPVFGGLIQVRTPADIEYLVKEGEIVTGNPGRKFVIEGTDRLAYRITWHSTGYHVERLDESGHPSGTIYLLPAQLSAHDFGEALARGQLFTPELSR